ncbi:hypothetical protein ACJRO7_018530 [Eucalyptus globulus]|uniref:Uncharacterized protein n=1 Tax=Eucalyptus globulus TaxID=34317 RepID=A0ABD3KU15_EUCGL
MVRACSSVNGKSKVYRELDDPAKSYDVLVKLADIARAVEALRDLTYKAEEAKLITQLVEMDAINYALFKQAYTSSLDMSKFLDRYEMLKLLKGPYDVDGVLMVIKAESNGNYHEKRRATNGGITSATVKFEFDYAYGCLQRERGVHRMISGSETGSTTDEVALNDLFLLFPEISEGKSGILLVHINIKKQFKVPLKISRPRNYALYPSQNQQCVDF